MARFQLGFRTRLVLLFVLLAIAPIGLLTFFYLRYLTTTIEHWQNPGIERTLENSLALARDTLERYRDGAAEVGQAVLETTDLDAGADRTSEILQRKVAAFGIEGLALYRREAGRWTRWAAGVAPGADPPPSEIAPEVAEAALSGSPPPPLDLSSRSVSATLPAAGDPPERLLLVAVQPPEEAMEKIRILAGDADLYRRLAAYERIQAGTIVIATSALVALVAVAAFIVARALARNISRPILELVEGTRRVSSGDLDHPVEVRARDEIGLLVTSFNQMTNDLKVSKEHLRRAERVAAWRDVARRIAHEIKNPLTPVQLSIHRLRKRMPADQPETEHVYTECLDLMETEVANLRRLADEFSKFARMPAPNPTLSDLGVLTHSVADLYRGSRAEAKVEVRVPDDLPKVRVDPDQFRQALGNLIKNALEAMPSGGTVSVELETSLPPARPGVVVTVADTGPGLPAEIKDRIFDPYVTSKKEGSGLGLAIVHRIVTDHGGTIEVESEEGRGAAFRLLFPSAMES